MTDQRGNQREVRGKISLPAIKIDTVHKNVTNGNKVNLKNEWEEIL